MKRLIYLLLLVFMLSCSTSQNSAVTRSAQSTASPILVQAIYKGQPLFFSKQTADKFGIKQGDKIKKRKHRRAMEFESTIYGPKK